MSTDLVEELTKIDKIIEGLQIFKSLGARWTWADHDKIGVEFAAHKEVVPSESQKARLDELGWFVDSTVDAWATFT